VYAHARKCHCSNQTDAIALSIDDLMEKLLFLYKLEVALDQSKKDHVQSHESVKEKHKKWLQ